MVRSYLRHEPTQAYGLICSPLGRAALAPDGKTAVVPALEDVLVWDVKTGEQRGMWHETGHASPVTAIAHAPHGSDAWAVGYADGSIRIWDAASAIVRLTLTGHRSAVTALRFDRHGLVLASGSQDTNITLWDIVAEAGMFRLRGHRDAITDFAFVYADGVASDAPSTSAQASSDSKRYLISTSKDGLIKIWDTSLQHCVETLLPGKGELWSVAALQGTEVNSTLEGSGAGALVLVGDSEGKARIFEISARALAQGVEGLQTNASSLTGAPSTDKMLQEHGQLDVTGGRRISQITFGPASKAQQSRFLAISASDRSVDIFRLRSEDDVKKKMARRRRRLKEKADKKGSQEDPQNEDALAAQPTWTDRLEGFAILRPSKGKLKSFAFAESEDDSSAPNASTSVPMLLALGNNSLEVHHIPHPKRTKGEGSREPVEPALASVLDLAGHRAEARALALSSDDSLLASADGAGTLKVWNTSTGRMVRTLPCGYALSLAWLPDDQHVLVGCKDGTLKTYDVRSGVQLEDIPAHQGPIWSVIVHPDGRSCLTASGDKDVKFWDFEAAARPEDNGDDKDGARAEGGQEDTNERSTAHMQLALVHVRTLKMTDDVLCARYSPDGRLLALSLLDSTVKVFFADTLKFFLSLYGHKLPVLSLDISGDSKLCVTVSADKNAKIWGLDFGDCHRSLFAHEESIVGVAFEKGSQGGGLLGGREGASHHFWTCAKDGKLKYWDGDRFQCIQTLSGHHGDVCAVAVGSQGSVLASSGADRSIRIWEKTEEPLFLEEEREREIEEMYERGPAEQRGRDDDERAIGSLAEGADAELQQQVNGDGVKEVEGVTTSTKETLMAGERLLEAIEVAQADLAAQEEYERQQRTSGLDLAPPAHTALMTHTFETGEEVDAHAYVLKVVSKILPSHLDDALLVLPFDAVVQLMGHLEHWASKEWSMALVSRILFFLLRNYHAQIVANRIMRTTLLKLRSHMRASLQRQKMTIGYNLAGLQYVRARLVERRTGDMYMREGFDLDNEAVKQRLDQSSLRKRKMVA